MHRPKSLLSELDWRTTQLANHRAQNLNPRTDPREAYETEEDAKRWEKERTQLKAHLTENEQLYERIELLITALTTSDFQSAHRTLALRHLEDAQARIQRESGYV